MQYSYTHIAHEPPKNMPEVLLMQLIDEVEGKAYSTVST